MLLSPVIKFISLLIWLYLGIATIHNVTKLQEQTTLLTAQIGQQQSQIDTLSRRLDDQPNCR